MYQAGISLVQHGTTEHTRWSIKGSLTLEHRQFNDAQTVPAWAPMCTEGATKSRLALSITAVD
jgi:hypothetical protein